MGQKPWGGRFSEGTDELVEAFTSSIAVDSRLYAVDIRGSEAHAKTLAKAGVISEEEAGRIIEGLGKIRREIEEGEFAFSDALEDIHMHIESRLFEIIGDPAKKLHTGRSRNDQVALDARLYLREETDRVIGLLHGMRAALVTLAEKNRDVVLPGYTHLQRAQPVRFPHHLLAYYEMFTRDAARFSEARTRMNVLPLGSAALAGTTYPLDREYTAKLLEFDGVTANSMDAVADRDFMMEFAAGAAICMTHLSRLSEEIVLWSSSEFKFITLPDAFATGSSIMPQKKNPDVAELVRGKTGRVFGSLTALLTLMKGLPLAYNRDMQEDKIPLFDAVDTLKACLAVMARMVPEIRVEKEAMARAASTGYQNATDLADYLVEKGVPFRQAHSVAGKAVAFGIEAGKELEELTLDELRAFSPAMGEDVFACLTVEAVVDRRKVIGGTGAEPVNKALAAARKALGDEGR